MCYSAAAAAAAAAAVLWFDGIPKIALFCLVFLHKDKTTTNKQTNKQTRTMASEQLQHDFYGTGSLSSCAAQLANATTIPEAVRALLQNTSLLSSCGCSTHSTISNETQVVPFDSASAPWIGLMFLAVSLATGVTIVCALWFSFRFLLPSPTERRDERENEAVVALRQAVQDQAATIAKQQAQIVALQNITNTVIDAMQGLAAKTDRLCDAASARNGRMALSPNASVCQSGSPAASPVSKSSHSSERR